MAVAQLQPQRQDIGVRVDQGLQTASVAPRPLLPVAEAAEVPLRQRLTTSVATHWTVLAHGRKRCAEARLRRRMAPTLTSGACRS